MYKALKSFCGAVSMTAGDVKDISDKDVAKDLLEAGYIAEVKAKAETKAEAKPESKTAKK